MTYTIGSEGKVKAISAGSDNDKVKPTVSPAELPKTGEATVSIDVGADAKEGPCVVTVTAKAEGTTLAELVTKINVTITAK